MHGYGLICQRFPLQTFLLMFLLLNPQSIRETFTCQTFVMIYLSKSLLLCYTVSTAENASGP